MRILLVLKRFDFGGAENHVCDLANSLNKLGHEVYIVAGSGRQVSRLNNGIKFIPYRFRDLLVPINILLLYRLVKKYRIEVIHAHQRLAIFTSCILGKLTNIPVVVTIHGRTRFDLKSKFTQKTADRIIFVSNQVLIVSSCYNDIKEKSIVIPNGVEVTDLNLEKKPFSITYVSRIDRNHSKVILMIIKQVIPLLIKEFQGLTFNIVGEGDYFKNIKEDALTVNHILGKEVCRVFGYQPDIRVLFQSSSLVLGVGRVSLEALACGIPVLSINQKRMGTIISTSNYPDYKINNFVAIENGAPTVEELSFLVKNFFHNMDEWHEEAKKIQGLIRTDFNLLNLASQIVSTYEEAIYYKQNFFNN